MESDGAINPSSILNTTFEDPPLSEKELIHIEKNMNDAQEYSDSLPRKSQRGERMKCSQCGDEITFTEYPECFINFHRSWRGADWNPPKDRLQWFEFHHIEEEGISRVDSVLRFCSTKCLMEWCKDIYENGYWQD